MRATWLRSAHWPPQSPARPMSSVAPLTLRQRSRPGRPSSRRGVNDRGVGHPAALTHLAVVPRSRPRGLTPIRTPISSPCPSASTNKPAAQRVPAGIQTCSAGNWGSRGRRFKSRQPDREKWALSWGDGVIGPVLFVAYGAGLGTRPVSSRCGIALDRPTSCR